MKNHEICLRIPYTARAVALIEEAIDRMPIVCKVSRAGQQIHVDATVSAYELEDAYRYLWKELCIRLATRKAADHEEPDEWSELLADHAMKLRGVVETFAELYPQVEQIMDDHLIGGADGLDHYPTLVSIRALCVTAQEMLDSLSRKEEPSV